MAKLYLGNGRLDCLGTKGTGVDRMPWCETLRKLVGWMLRWLEYLWPWPLTLKFYGQIVSWEWEARMSWNGMGRSRFDALMWNTKAMSQLDTALTGVYLALTFNLEFSGLNCISGMGRLVVMEQNGWESIGCLEMKHNHYVTSRQRDTVRDQGDLWCRRFRRLV